MAEAVSSSTGVDRTERESAFATASRRALTVGLVVFFAGLMVATAVLWIPIAWIYDRLYGGRRSALACGLFLTWYLGCELFGILASAWLWLFERGDPARYERRNFELQCRWAAALWAGATRLLGIDMEARGDDCLAPGHYVLMCRHATIVDVLVPALWASGRHDIPLRYVLKRELLWDPCMDIVGNRMPNYFARRGSSDSAREIEGVKAMAQGLRRDEGLMIFPEGTRFTEEKRARLIARARESGDPERAAYTESLHCVLPPRLGGPLALLEVAPEADVVFCAHAGIDHVTSFWDLWRGGLEGAVLEAEFWRVPNAEIPRERAARAAWLQAQWQRIDAWVGERHAALQARSDR